MASGERPILGDSGAVSLGAENTRDFSPPLLAAPESLRMRERRRMEQELLNQLV